MGLFSNFNNKNLEPTIKTITPKKGKRDVTYTSISFVTLPCFNVYYNMFYPQNCAVQCV